VVQTERRGGGAARPPRIQQSVKLTPHVRQRLRLAAVALERELSGLVEEAVTRYLDQVKHERKAQGLPPLPEPVAKPER
jgi:hypothetical protein